MTTPNEETLINDQSLETFRSIRNGWFVDDLSTGLNALVERVQSTGKGGTMSIVLTIKPATKGDNTALTVVDKIKIKPPELEQAATLMFADEENNLLRENPNQMALKFASQTPPEDRAKPINIPS